MNQIFCDEELVLLNEVIGEYLTELRVEIVNTDSYEYKQRLKRKELFLRSIRVKLEQSRELSLN